jgi:anti-anti-sigma factor
MEENRKAIQLAIAGELSIFVAADLRQQLLDAFDTGAEVEVDLSRVSEVDSAGVQLLLAAQRESLARNKPLRFVGHSAVVVDLLELLNLAELLGDVRKIS